MMDRKLELEQKDRHARACPGHPRLSQFGKSKTWMAGTPFPKTRFALLPGHDGF
jgi:hypothetical protein